MLINRSIDFLGNFDQILPVGTLVNKGDVIARVHATSNDMAVQASSEYVKSISLSSVSQEALPVIYQTID